MIWIHSCVHSDIPALPVRIREMPVELLRFPVRALKVRVAGFKAPSVSSQEVVLPYSPKWSVKAAMEMIDLLHTSITVSVVVRNVAVSSRSDNLDKCIFFIKYIHVYYLAGNFFTSSCLCIAVFVGSWSPD